MLGLLEEYFPQVDDSIGGSEFNSPGGPDRLAQIERSDESGDTEDDTEDECWEECSDDEDCFLECLAGEPGQVTSHGHELAQISAM
jgi:hypothetical protein